MDKIFTGGACNGGGDGQTMGNNAFTNMMDFMINGSAQAAQKTEGFGPAIDQNNMRAMEAAFANQENMNAMEKRFEEMQLNQPPMAQFSSAPVQELAQPNMAQMNDLWNKPVENVEHINMQNVENKFSQYGSHPQQMFGFPGMMGPMMGPSMGMPMTQNMGPMQSNIVEEVKVVEEPEQIKKEDTQLYHDEMKEVTGSFIKDLEQVPSEKVQNSEFLSFLKKLNTGAATIEGDTIKEDPTKLKELQDKENQRRMDAAYYKQNLDRIIEETKDPEAAAFFKEEDAIKQKEFDQAFDPANLFRDVWDTGEMDEGELQRMMKSWKQHAEKSMNYYEPHIEEPPVETVIQMPKEDIFKFDENNPYDGVDDAYALACQLNEELKVHDAILALKAHLTKDPEHAASWRLLGQLYQEKDEDEKAIAYFKKAYYLDPYDLDSLLCLGVSCTNELNEKVANGYLMDWLRYNPEYCDLPIPQEPILNANELRDTLKSLLHQAHERNPTDVEVSICMGILEFGDRNYRGAAELFGKAAHENPTDYNLWNKYGAALANNLDTREALDIYNKTLELRPNLVRTWTNMGVAY